MGIQQYKSTKSKHTANSLKIQLTKPPTHHTIDGKNIIAVYNEYFFNYYGNGLYTELPSRKYIL